MYPHLQYLIFFLRIVAPCGTSALVASTEAKTLKSPNYPGDYPINIRCRWIISRNNSYGTFPGNPFEVTVTDIAIPCGDDFLEIKRTKSVRNSFFNTKTYSYKKLLVVSLKNPFPYSLEIVSLYIYPKIALTIGLVRWLTLIGH